MRKGARMPRVSKRGAGHNVIAEEAACNVTKTGKQQQRYRYSSPQPTHTYIKKTSHSPPTEAFLACVWSSPHSHLPTSALMHKQPSWEHEFAARNTNKNTKRRETDDLIGGAFRTRGPRLAGTDRGGSYPSTSLKQQQQQQQQQQHTNRNGNACNEHDGRGE